MMAAAPQTRPCQAASDDRGAARRCIVSGEMLPRDRLVRFVAGPDRVVVADLDERLPGRGLWVTANAEILAEAATGRHFSRALRGPVEAPPDLVARVEAGLASRSRSLIGLARRAGAAVAGFEKVRAVLRSGDAQLLIAASDGAADGRGKLAALAGEIPCRTGLRSDELGSVFGREDVVHVVVTDAGLARRIAAALTRLAGLRGAGQDEEETLGMPR